ncbi:MAG TPA: DMT family transporter [Candidatus Sulfotelmatobacter sp.]|nr:DMT family transporter [Candidatus Sulfotelmatobacter sp.]
MGILLGLLTALSWGSSDLLARFATRKIGTLRAMLYMQLIGFLLLTLALPRLGGLGHLDGSGWTPWAWGILAGVLNTFATLALYRSFEIGKLSIVAPISASYPALTMLLAAFTGEHLRPLRLAGLVLILIGVVIVARGDEVPGDANPLDEKGHPGKRHLGIGWALLSAVGFGFLFWILGTRAVPAIGSAQTVWLIRLTCVVLSAAVILFWRQPIGVPRADAKWFVLGMGILDTGAYVLNNYGMRLEQVSVVSVLSSMYGAVTVGLAATILDEKIARLQWLGVIGIFVGIGLISR